MGTKWRITPLALLSVGTVLIAIACRDERRPTITAPTGGPRLVLNGGTIADEWNGGPLHGAIFTTLPFGQVVNANTQYRRKIEVYLDGGPRNANSMAAGLNDGLYVFQITDPPGKNLLSMDPARCRVVQVKGGVILGTVAAPSIPDLGATTDNWADHGQNAKNACHIETTETDGASLSGQHDTNIDSESGGGTTVQMMPFLDTPNPGGVYKAWITPLAVYRQKGGDLNTVPGPASRAQTTGNAPDIGFKNPSRKNVKTDNFKVVERPPFIEITKLLDGKETSGWPVAVYEFIDANWVPTQGWKPTTARFPIPFNTSALACERDSSTYPFVKVTVDGQTSQVSTDLVQDEDGHAITCVNVPGVSTPKTVAVSFYNRTPKDSAKISIKPTYGVNEVDHLHTFTATVKVNPQESGWVNASDGTVISFTTSGTGTFIPSSKTCTTSGGTGACTIQLKNGTVGVDTVTATTTVLGLTVSTDGTAGSSDPGKKYWVDATMAIDPNDTNSIGESHKFTATFTAIPGTLPSAKTTFSSMGITITPPAGYVKGTDYTESTTCASPTVTDSVAKCSTTINSTKAGTYTADASGKVIIEGTLAAAKYSDTLARTTDGKYTSSAKVNKNSGSATKLYVSGSLSWVKIDGATPPRYLGGATFEVRRTADRFDAPVTTPVDTVVDDGTLDTDARDGYFKVIGLPLGTYCVKELIPPAGYLKYPPTEQCGIELTVAAPNATAQPFVNSLMGRMTGGTGKVEITDNIYLTSGFTIHCDILLSNNLEINWPDNKWHLDKPIATALCLDDPNVTPGQPDAPFDTFIGTAQGSLNGTAGAWVQFTFVDGGEPGKRADLAAITIWPGKIGVGTPVLDISLRAIKGNIQAHEDQPHK